MATLQNCTSYEMRSVIRFLSAEGVNPSEIHLRMLNIYGSKCIARSSVFEWVKKFKTGTESVQDAPRPGQANRTITEKNIRTVQEFILANRRIKLNEIASKMDISIGSAHNIVFKHLHYRKVCARWVPRQLTPELKQKRIDACTILLSRYENEGPDFLDRIVTGDESWVHHFQPECKQSSKEWRHSSSPKPKKFKAAPSAGKVMLTVFWDRKGVLVEDYMIRGTTVNSISYCHLLKEKLKPAIRTKRRGSLARGVLLQHDNARPHCSKETTEVIKKLKFEVLEHPPYSPDLAPSDYHIFGALKRDLGGLHFVDDDSVKEAVHNWFRSQSKEFFSKGIEALVDRWRKCIEKQGDYIEK